MPNTKLNTRNLLFLVIVVLLLLAGWYLWGPGGEMTSLNESNFAQFTAQFDRAAGDERLLVLVSPT